MAQLAHLSESKLGELRADIEKNRDRYLGNGFSDLVLEPGWSIGLNQDIEIDGLAELDGTAKTAEADLKNTKVVTKVLGAMSPSLANEERIWTRLAHVEGFGYSRDRWIKKGAATTDQLASIRTHFFAPTQTGIRDDHSISRLWWNGYIAKHCYPQDVDRGLELLLKTADIRSNIVERIWLTGRRSLATAVFKKMEHDGRIVATERNFREFMKVLNQFGGGVVFEAMSEAQVADFLSRCADESMGRLAAEERAQLA